ncbi:MAG: hypothetical protein O6940_09400 [Ignavibacteria bacterium]|nr:hypothetical protein [Ignavibacteria bacterium]
MIFGAFASIAVGIFIFIYHKVKVSSFKDYKDQYDYLKLKEIKMYLYTFLAFGIAIAMFLNTYNDETIGLSLVWFFVRFWIAGAIGTLFGYVNYLILVYYYPLKLEKKLVKLRYLPRISKAGNEMKLLSEEEEDVHLDEGMQAEENVFSVDYDVWVDQESGEVKIEKYPGQLEALKCGTCKFQTLRLVSEEILEQATNETEGALLKHYVCSYCKSTRTTQITIAKVIDSLDHFKIPENAVFKGDRKVKSIMMEIINNKGEAREFYFQNLNEAKKFLEEFDFEKLPQEKY